jgi:hypothetical protein
MKPQSSNASQTPHTTRVSGGFTSVNEALLGVAERALKDALLQQERPIPGIYTTPSQAADIAFGRAVAIMCDEARRLGVRAEELLVALKQAWSQLAPLRSRHLGDRDGDALRQIVTLSIEVFFESRSEPEAEGR